MCCLRRISLALLGPCSVLSLFLFFSGSCAANGVPGPSSEDAGIMVLLFFLIIAVNLPLNTWFYFGLLSAILHTRFSREPEVFSAGPRKFFFEGMLVVIVASAVGSFIDSMVFGLFFFGSALLVLSIGLFLVFLSFFVLSVTIQKTRLLDALLVALGILVINILFWFVIPYMGLGFGGLIAIEAIALLTLPLIFIQYSIKHKLYKKYFPENNTL